MFQRSVPVPIWIFNNRQDYFIICNCGRVFENCQMVGVRFHLSQPWFRRIKNDKEFSKHYAGKTVVYQWLQQFFGPSYLPSDGVNDGLISLMANAPPNVEHFTDYIVDTFIDENS